MKNMRSNPEIDNYCRAQEHGLAKLTNEQVLAIRADCRVQRIIALEYKVSLQTINKIKNNRTWQSLK